uniref:RxLR effector candidate protein n=1 Tax=Peronospora matthiolae TaxID=2874970 RepID=A0AAV1TWC6_9STRA
MTKGFLFFVLALFASSGCHALAAAANGQLAELTTTNSDQETPLDTDGKRMRQVGDVTNEERFFSTSAVKEYWMKTFEEYCTMVGAIYARLSSIVLSWGPVKQLIEAGRESKVVQQLRQWVSQVLEELDIKFRSPPGETNVDVKSGSPPGEANFDVKSGSPVEKAELRSRLGTLARKLKIKHPAKMYALKSATDAFDEKVKAADALIPQAPSYKSDKKEDTALFEKLHAEGIEPKHCAAVLDNRAKGSPYFHKKDYAYYAVHNWIARYELYYLEKSN